MKIWVNTLVQNEERYVWYAVMSVINHVDKILIWDSGSTDNTVKIIKEIKKKYPKKIEFRQVVQKDIFHYTELRQQMLKQTRADWLMILDGDEVWWDQVITKVTERIRKHGDGLESIVNQYYNVVGDIYHFQEKAAGMYEIGGKKGHLSIRFINTNIPGLKYDKPHGQLAIVDNKGGLIQERDRKKRLYVNDYYMHFTNMRRSVSSKKDKDVVKRSFKYKYELGESFPKDFYFPESFFRPRPKIVNDVWKGRTKHYFHRALIETPFKKLKRKFLQSNKSGY